MNYIGSYHADLRLCAPGICDAPCTRMGRMALACADTASDAKVMAMAWGIMRNQKTLARTLECPMDATQAQIVLAAYQRWGEEYALRIEGPCMSCVMDREQDKMLLVRDRMGECSLFFASKGDRLVFSDHPDSILKTGFLQPVLDREAACELFGLGPARTPGKTYLAGMESLKPGCMLICEGKEIRIRRYFELSAAEHNEDEKTTIEHTRDLLERAMDGVVRFHPGCMLSGGLDSTALTALLRQRLGRVDSYSVDYEDNDKDFEANAFRPEMDAPYIALAVQKLGTRHKGFVLSQKSLADGLEKALALRGFPGMGDIDTSLMLFAGCIAKHNRSVLSGECGDEVFGGYPWFRGNTALSEDAFPWSGSMALRNGVLRSEVRQKLDIDAYVRESLCQSLDSYDISCIEDEDARRLFRMQRLCFDYFMPNLQERAVKMCEGMGVSVITPLCDDRLVQYVYNVPWRMKTMGSMEKGLFRAAVRDLLPEKLLKRKKSPYPKTCSPTYTNLIRDRMAVLLRDEHVPLWQLADRDFVQRLVGSSLNPADTPWFGQLMAGPQLLAYLFQINAWMQERNVQVEL